MIWTYKIKYNHLEQSGQFKMAEIIKLIFLKKKYVIFHFFNILGSNQTFYRDKHPVKISSQTDKRFLRFFGRRVKNVILRKLRLKYF